MLDVATPFLDQLFAAGLLIPTGVDGLYGRSGTYERVVEAVDRMILRLGAKDGAEVMRFPPGSARPQFERSGYLNGFPHLAGTVHCFCGGEAEHREMMRCVAEGEDWTGGQEASDIVLTPAACYPVYPAIGSRGPIAADGVLVNVASWCFRHEPSNDPSRQQMFRMHEYVRIGSPEQILAFRQLWIDRMSGWAAEMDLPHEVDVANDPFFGRPGKVMARSQRQQTLKFEIMMPTGRVGELSACTSFNYHLDHFGAAWDLRLSDGSVAHSGCIGFGVERLALALFRQHGLDPDAWPEKVKTVMFG